MPRHLVIMARAPVLGQVKTRLAADIGAAEAMRFYRAELARVARVLGRDRRWQTRIAVTPDTALAAPVWPRGPGRMTQGSGDLGARMGWIMASLPPGPAVIVGADIPDLAARHVAAAFAALGRADAVFGPAGDGGYYLLGLRRSTRIPDVFGAVRWSGQHALADSVRNLAGRPVAFIEPLPDIDTGADLARWRAARRGR